MSISKNNKKNDIEILQDALVKEVMAYSEIDDMINYLMNYMRGIVETVLEEKEKEIENFYKREKKNQSSIKMRKRFKAETNIKTIIGPIRYKRMKYKFTHQDGSNESYYVLDEIIGRVKGSKYSKDFIKRLVNQVVNQSYGKSSEQMKFFGSDISRQGAWNIITDIIGARLFEYEKTQTINFVKAEEENAGHKISTLFIELDGLYVSVHDPKDYKKNGLPHRKKEMKLGKAYIGWAKRYDSEKSSYKTVGTVYACGFEDVETFRLLFAGKINEIYDYYGVEQIVVNGDGAQWIFNTFKGDKRAILQLDLYHIYSNIRSWILDKELANTCVKLVKASKFEELSSVLTEAYENARKFDKRKGIGQLLTYINNNFFYLKRHNQVDIVKSNEDLEVRGLGTIEGSIRNVLSYRLKINGVWSYSGAKIMGMLLCYYHEGRLDKVLDKILTEEYTGSYMGELEKELKKYYSEEIQKSSAAYKSVNALQRIGAYSYPVNGGPPTINLKEEIMKSPILGRYLNWPYDYDPPEGGLGE